METLRCLVVDDEPKMRAGMVRALRDFTVDLPDTGQKVSFTFEVAETGEEALEKLAAQGFDLMLLDHKLPGIQGMEVLEKVTAEGRDMEIVMVTAYASIETAVSATKRGAFDFLAKPFTPAELKATVQKAARHLSVQRHARRLQEEKHKIRFQFLSVVAHELKAPLAAIEGYLHLLEDPEIAANPEQSATIVTRSLARLEGMRKLILDLLDLTRIESGQKKRDVGPVDLAAVAKGCLETARAAGAARNISLSYQGPDRLPMEADNGELEIILNNFLSNAVKYNRDNGSVTLALEDREDTACVAVTDTGIGMSEEECQRLFGEFVRIKNRKTRGIDGSGLGLSIVKKLVTLYQGSVAVTSTPDVGSTFTITLKKASAPA